MDVDDRAAAGAAAREISAGAAEDNKRKLGNDKKGEKIKHPKDQGGDEADDESGAGDEDKEDGTGNEDTEGGEDEDRSAVPPDVGGENMPDETMKKKQKHKLPFNPNHIPSKLFDNSITVYIPMDVTVDLKVAIQHTRKKQIRSIYKRFPSLK